MHCRLTDHVGKEITEYPLVKFFFHVINDFFKNKKTEQKKIEKMAIFFPKFRWSKCLYKTRPPPTAHDFLQWYAYLAVGATNYMFFLAFYACFSFSFWGLGGGSDFPKILMG